MADFYPLLTRAIAGLDPNTGDARRALYDRARAALVAQLRAMSPPPSESEITRERLGLEEAIRKIETEVVRGQRAEAARRAEAEAAQRAAPPPAPPPAVPKPPREPVPPPPVAAPPKDAAFPSKDRIERFATPASNRQKLRSAIEEVAASPPPPPPPRVERRPSPRSDEGLRPETGRFAPEPPHRESAPPPAPPVESEPFPSDIDFRTDPDLSDPFEAARDLDQPIAPPATAREATRSMVRDARASLRAAPPEPEFDDDARLPPPNRPVVAPDRDDVRPSRVKSSKRAASRRVEEDEESGGGTASSRMRLWAMIIAVLVLVLIAAAVGLFAASGLIGFGGPQQPPGPVTPVQPDKPKISDRITQDAPRAPQTTPSPQSPAAPAQPPAPAQTPPPAAALPVTQRAILYEEDPAAGQQGQLLIGTVTWRTETITPGGNLPPDIAVRAEVQVPDRRMSMSLLFKRNSDPALPASHTLELMFTTPADFPFGGVAKVPGVLAKRAEGQRGAPLAGLAVDVTPGFFIVGLSAIEADLQRNILLLKERAWIDLPIVYKNGRRAILSIERGVPGDRAFADVFNAWGQ